MCCLGNKIKYLQSVCLCTVTPTYSSETSTEAIWDEAEGIHQCLSDCGKAAECDLTGQSPRPCHQVWLSWGRGPGSRGWEEVSTVWEGGGWTTAGYLRQTIHSLLSIQLQGTCWKEVHHFTERGHGLQQACLCHSCSLHSLQVCDSIVSMPVLCHFLSLSPTSFLLPPSHLLSLSLHLYNRLLKIRCDKSKFQTAAMCTRSVFQNILEEMNECAPKNIGNFNDEHHVTVDRFWYQYLSSLSQLPQ